MESPVWYIDNSTNECIGKTNTMILVGNTSNGKCKLLSIDSSLVKLFAGVSGRLFYREDQLQRIELDAPRAYRQRPATDADRADEDRSEIISDDGWIDEHLEVIDASDGALISDLFQ